MEGTIIRGKNLAIGYRQGTKNEVRVHEHLDFGLQRGTLTCLLGPNGAGKSTLLRTLGGTQKPLAGTVEIEGINISGLSENEISHRIGLVLTDKIFAGGLRVKELVGLGRHPHVGFFGKLRDEDHLAVDRAMGATEIGYKAESYVAELSDGERQKVMIAKALAQECPVILLDEPTAFLDVVSCIEIMNLLHDIAVAGKTVLMSTHDIEQALLLADKLWLLSSDQGIVTGTTEDLVLRGDMDRFFRRGNIAFDSLSGNFRFHSGDGATVSVKAEGELFFWTKNALMRNGFRVEKAEKDTERGSGIIRMEIHSPDRIEVFRGDEPSRIYASFEELIFRLKNK